MNETFEFHIGDTYSRDFTITGYSEPINDVYFTVKKEEDDKFYMFQKTLYNGITLVDVTYDEDGETILSRTYNVLISPSDTEYLKPEFEYPFDIQINKTQLPEDIKNTIITGTLILDKASTRVWDE